MSRFRKQNLQHIKNIFEEKTGTDLNPAHRIRTRRPVRMTLVFAGVIALCLMMVAFTQPIFSPLAGDELSLSGTYDGNGIVSVYVENSSDKELRFQEQVKLVNWGTSEEVESTGGRVKFENTVFPPHSSGTMTIDLSEAYDIDALETAKPSETHTLVYYLLLTNQNFLFGQDWMCSFSFVSMEDVPEEPTETTPPDPSLLRAQTIEDIEAELQFYFEDAYHDELPAFNSANFDYLQKVQEVLMRTEGTLVHPAEPWITIGQPEGHVFDDAYPLDKQHWLVGLNYHSIDGYYRVIGSTFSGSGSDKALTLKAGFPFSEGQVDGGTDLPLVYLFVYEKTSLEVEDPYTFIYGRILPFEEMDPYLVFEDDRYVIYDMTDLFYTDLDEYIAYFLSCNDNVYYDEQIRERVHNIYDLYRNKETLAGLIQNRQEEAERAGYKGE